MTPTPSRIGLLSLSLDLYQTAIPEYIPSYEDFHRKCREILGGMGEIAADALCYSRVEIERAIAQSEAAHADVLVVVCVSYTPSLSSLAPLLRTSLPLLIWNTQRLGAITPEFSVRERIENHGIQGPQDLCNCLKRARRTYGIVSGHCEDPQHLADLRDWLQAAHAVSLSRRIKVGLLGHPFQGMGDFGVDETIMAATWGPTVEHLTLADLAGALGQVQPADLAREMAADHELFEFAADIGEEDHRRSAGLSLALRRLAQARGLQALTMNFMAFAGGDPRIQTCPYLGVNHLIAEGYGYAGEGNVTVAALDALLGQTFGRSSFCEMFTADFENNRVFFYHMAEGNYAMARPGAPPKLIAAPFVMGNAQPYLVPTYSYAPGPSTFVNITTDPDGRFFLIAFEGELQDVEIREAMTAPYFFTKFDRPLGDFLDAYGMAGGTHHLCRVEGRQMKQLARMAHMLGLELQAI